MAIDDLLVNLKRELMLVNRAIAALQALGEAERRGYGRTSGGARAPVGEEAEKPLESPIEAR